MKAADWGEGAKLRSWLFVFAAAGLSGCHAHDGAPPAPPVQLQPAAQEVPYFPQDAPDIVLPPGTNVNPIPVEAAPKALVGSAAIAQANKAGRREVNSNGFDGVKYVFELGKTEMYPIRVPRDGETIIRFLPGETLDDYTFPKNPLFKVGETSSGSAGESSNILSVQCFADKNDDARARSSSFTAITDKREYPFELTCQSIGNKVIGFRHPVSGMESDRPLTDRAMDRDARARKFARVKATLLENIDCASYRMEGQIMNLRAQSLKACSDGYSTTIVFPMESQVGSTFPMPAIFPVGQQLPFNYIRKDNPTTGQRQWVADKVITSAVMQHGAETITITKGP